MRSLVPVAEVKRDQPQRRLVLEVRAGVQLPDAAAGDLTARVVRDLLHDAGELDLHAARQVQVVLVLEDVGDAALARLAVHADDRLVRPADVERVDRQVRHAPGELPHGHARGGGVLLQRLEPLLDGVLVRAGEGGVDQVAGVRVARVHGQLVAVLDRPPHLVDVAEVDERVDALAEQVEAEGDQADVAGALAVAEQAPLHPVRTGHDAQLGGGHRGAPVVVRVQRQDHAAAALAQRAVEPLDLVGVRARDRHLHRGRQVQHDGVLRRRLPDVHDRLADVEREVELGAGEGLGAVLPADRGALEELLGVLLAPLRTAHGDVPDAVPVEAEDDPALQGGGRVVEVDQRGAAEADERLDGALDQLLTGLREHLDRHVGRHEVLLDEHPDEVEVGGAGGREADLDLLVAHLDEQPEHPHLAVGVHRVDEGLVAVAQVDAAPLRGAVDRPARPGAVGDLDRGERAVAGVLLHGGLRGGGGGAASTRTRDGEPA